MKISASLVEKVLRYFLGIIFFVFGLNGFLNFIPVPPMNPEAGSMMTAFFQSGYMLPFIKMTEVLVGACLLSGLFVPLALVVLAPITLNIIAFHLFLDPANMAMPVIILAAHLWLARCYMNVYRPLLRKKPLAN